MFKDLAKDYAKFLKVLIWEGLIFSSLILPMLVEEFLRAGVEFDYSRRRIIDAQKIYHLMEKRNLAAALKFYCNKDLTHAHSAAADTQATLDVLLAQVERYENQPVTDNMGKLMGTIQNDMDVLHQLTATDMVDLAGRMIRNNKGEVIFNFRKA